jgi:transposase
MPSGTKLTEREQGQIDALHRNGMSNRAIACQLGRSHKVINSYVKNSASYGTVRRSGRPKKLTSRDERAVWKAFSNSTMSIRKYVANAPVQVGRETIRKTIHKKKELVHSKMVIAPRLKACHKTARLQFCRDNMSTDWNKVCPINF